MNNTGIIASLTTSAGTVTEPEYYLVTVEPYHHGQTELPREMKLPVDSELQSPSPTYITQKRSEGVSIKKQTDMKNSSKVKWASAILALFGLAVLGASYMIGYATLPSLLLSLEGVSVFVIAIFFYFVPHGRLVRSEVSDAKDISSTELVNALLAPITGESKGIYIPSSRIGSTKLFLPTSNSDLRKAYGDDSDIKNVSVSGMDGIYITPSGYSLLTYAKSLGATFTYEGLENEIADILVNGTELASRVEVKRKADIVRVRINDLADSLSCKTIRQKNPASCSQVGCPMCSFVACMVAECTGKLAMISEINPDGKALDITYKLL
jgi:hypothetical protein